MMNSQQGVSGVVFTGYESNVNQGGSVSTGIHSLPEKKTDDRKATDLPTDRIISNFSSSAISSGHASASSSTTPIELKPRVKLYRGVVKELEDYKEEKSLITHTRVAEIIRHQRQDLYKAASKNSAIRKWLPLVINKYNKQATAAKEDPDDITTIREEFKKIMLANKQSKKQLIRITGQCIETILADYNQSLSIGPSDKLLDRIEQFLDKHLHWLISQSIEVLVTGKKRSAKTIIQLDKLRATLSTLTTKSPKSEFLVKIIETLLSTWPNRASSTLPTSSKQDESTVIEINWKQLKLRIVDNFSNSASQKISLNVQIKERVH